MDIDAVQFILDRVCAAIVRMNCNVVDALVKINNSIDGSVESITTAVLSPLVWFAYADLPTETRTK